MTNNNPKKILFVSRPIAPPWDEASKNFAYNLAKEIAGNNSDLEIHLMTKGTLPDLPKNIIQHPIYTSSQNDIGFSQKIRMIWFLIRNARKFDFVHLFFTPTKLNSLILKYILKKGQAQDLSLQNNQTKIIQTIATLREDLFSDEEIKKMIFGDKIITYSEYAKNKLQKLGFDNVAKIYPGIDLEEYKPKNSEYEEKNNNKDVIPEDRISSADRRIRNSSIRNPETESEQKSFETNKNKNRFTVNFTGEYVRLGAMDDIIDSFIKISQKIPEAKLSLAVRVKNEKDAEKKKKVIAKLKKNNLLERVSFHDDGNYKMSDIYNLCDISLFPVRNMKGKFDVPLAVIEAMACAKPVILSDIQILKEFANEKNSLTIKAGNIKQLIQAILELYQDEKKRFTLGKQAREYVAENFNIQKAGREYSKIYNSL